MERDEHVGPVAESWDEACGAVEARCGGSPMGHAVPTSSSEWPWVHVKRIMDFEHQLDVYRVVEYQD